MKHEPSAEGLDAAALGKLAGRLVTLACWAFGTAILLAILSSRCLYADGSFYLAKVLEAGTFVPIPKHRYCATFFFEFPVVALVKLGVTNLRALTLAFGAGCFLEWPIALMLCYRIAPRKFWLALLACGAGYINAGFMPVGEYNVAHAFFWPALFALLFSRPLKPIAAASLLGSSLILLYSYESLLFLGPPLALLALGRIVDESEKNWGRAVLGISALLLLAAAGIALAGIVHPDSANNYGGFKYGILRIVRSPTWTVIWTFIWLALGALICATGKGFTQKNFALEKALIGFTMAIWALGPILHPADTGADRGYELRSLQLIVPFGLMIVAWLSARRPNWFEQRHHYLVCIASSLLLAQSLWLMAATWQWQGFVGVWRGVLACNTGPIPLKATPFTAPAQDGQALSFEWTWANPSLSIFLSPTNHVQSLILSGSKPPWQPFDPLNAGQLPKLDRYGLDYTKYVEALSKSAGATDKVQRP